MGHPARLYRRGPNARLTTIKLVLLVFFLLTLPYALAESFSKSLRVDGQTRSYTLFAPTSRNPDAPLPLVLVLHGRYGTGAGIAELTDFNTLAEEYGFVALYPDGVDNQWNYVEGVPGYPTDAPDDTAFLKALIRRVSSDYAVDLKRIYVAGFSNGGFMAERLACDAPGLFAAFASVAAAGFSGMTEVCPRTNPVHLLFVHGTYDTNIPWNGLSRQVGNQVVPILFSVPDTLAFWSLYNGCDPDVRAHDLPVSGKSPGTSVRVLTFTACPEGSALSLYAVQGGGHNWPGKLGRLPEAVAGAVTLDIDASEVIWKFFSQYALASP